MSSGETLPAPTVELGRGVEWIPECYAEPEGHLHVSVFVVRAPEGDILIDSGSFVHRDSLSGRIHEATGGRGPGR